MILLVSCKAKKKKKVNEKKLIPYDNLFLNYSLKIKGQHCIVVIELTVLSGFQNALKLYTSHEC